MNGALMANTTNISISFTIITGTPDGVWRGEDTNPKGGGCKQRSSGVCVSEKECQQIKLIWLVHHAPSPLNCSLLFSSIMFGLL